ncbi:polyprotein [Chinese yam necrotic mosaic virus]|uniref:Polyprotein n=7 Tax=Chinese yam necrotic mosaic virus TaxID=128818 RepID=J7MAS6_9POTY|nr:polyprotein [Chinese yam necrotic mosaic virus]BAM36463.1 polyprotein [Chinese yam necrotic mosaic virus]
MATVKSDINFKVENVDILSTHSMQMLTGKPLTIPDRTRALLVEIVGKRYQNNDGNTSADFVMLDGKGAMIANMCMAITKGMKFKDYKDGMVNMPQQTSFAECDKVVKCVKVQQQHLLHARLPTNDYVFGGMSKSNAIPMIKNMVPKSGSCFLSAIVAMSYFVTPEFDEIFMQTINDVLGELGSWPTLQNVSKAMQFILAKVPTLSMVPLPVIAVTHEKKLIHICDQRGVPNGWHILKIGTVAELANAGFIKHTKLNGYFVGAPESITDDKMFYTRNINKVKNLMTLWRSPERFVEAMANDIELTAFILLSPSLLSKLYNLLSIGSSEALKIEALERANSNKIVVASLINIALQGVRVKMGETSLEKVWLHLLNVLTANLSIEESRRNTDILQACNAVYNELIKEKNYMYHCEKQIYNLTDKQFEDMFGCSRTWHSKLCDKLSHLNVAKSVQQSSVKLSCFSDGITHRTIQAVTHHFIMCFIRLLIFAQHAYSILRFFFLLAACCWGFMSITNLVFMAFKAVVMRKLATNYEKLLIFASIFCLYEVGRFIIKKRKANKDKAAGRTTELQAYGKSSEKQMMAAMAMVTLFVHAFDMDLALMMSNSLNHVARLANMLTDTTTGWLTSGGGTQELQMKLFDVALEVDETMTHEMDQQAAMDCSNETFAAWINEQVLLGNDNTRPLAYGRDDSVFYVTRDNAIDVGQDMCDTKNAWSQVIGQTGSGKSTRVPLSYYNKIQTLPGRNRSILICEPTKATTQNVAAALSTQHGKQVFFKHEGKEQAGDPTIQVMTYGSAFYRSCNNPAFLSNFDAVFLDESHLVSAHALALESLLNKNNRVRKFYLSATPRKQFPEMTGSRRFEIFEHQVESGDVNDLISAIGKGTIMDATKFGEKVLVFLSGKKECDRAATKVNSTNSGVKAISLHRDNFSANYNRLCHDLTQPGKIYIFATNILETGVTLNVDVVVDFGFTNTPVLNTSDKTLLLNKRRVTQAERKQRIGRAGRLREGHAIVIGKTSTPFETVSADVVFEAALLSFIHNLDVYVNAHFDQAWLSSITRDQAKTMMAFKISPFIMKDLVFANGHIRSEMLEFLKPHLHHSANIKTTNYQCVNHIYESWPRLDHHSLIDSMQNNEEKTKKIHKMRTPFITHDLNQLDLEMFANCVEKYRPNVLTRWGRPVEQTTNVLMHVNQENIHATIRIANLLRYDYQQQIQQKKQAQQLHKDSPFAYFFSSKVVDELASNIGKQVAMAQRNVSKLDKFISRLEMFATMNEMAGDVEVTQQEMHEIGQCLDLQAEGTFSKDNMNVILSLETLPQTTFRDAIIIGRKKAIWGIMILCCAAFGGLAWWLLWDDDEGLNNDENKDRRNEVCSKVLEMKGKSFNRDRRNPMMQDHFDAADFYMRDVEDFASLRSRRKVSRVDDAVSPVLRYAAKSRPFITLYDINVDSEVATAVFQDHNGQAFYETANPLKNMDLVREHLNKHKAKDGTQIFWSDESDFDIFCKITKTDGTIMKVKLTPHEPLRMARRGTQGFVEKEDCYRQTGQAEILQHPGVNLEMATRLPENKLNLQVADMIGKVSMSEGTIHCILYKDFILMPAHAMIKQLPMEISFKHFTITIDTLPEAYCFPGFDIVLIKRPAKLAPVRCHATLAQATDGMIVQMVHKKSVSDKTVLTITAPIHQRDDWRWAHQIPTVSGMCGAPVIDVASGKIVGIHVLADSLKMHNVFETFPSQLLEIINTNDKKVHQRYHQARVNDWTFLPEAHGYFPSELVGLQMESFEFIEFSRDTTMYTVDNFNRDATAGGLLKSRVVEESKTLPVGVSATHMSNVAYMNGLLNPRHTITGESPFWREFKRCHPKQTKGIEEFENAYAPSVLSYDAYWKDLLKFNRAEFKADKIDKDILKCATLALVKQLKDSGMQQTKIRTVEEVLDDVQWGKAAGPMYAMKKLELCKDLSEEDLTALAIHCRTQLLKGKNCGIWNGSMKAELRVVEKVLQKKTRVFTAAPITTLIGSKFFVDDFNKQFYGTHLKASHTVGINKFQRGWEKLYNFLNVDGWLHGSGDGTRFDSSLDPFWFDILYSIRSNFFCEEDRQDAKTAMAHMYREFVYTPIHTITGQVLVKKLGNNSGQPSTVVDNTLILMLSFLYAYIRKTNDRTCAQINQRFKFVCNGDDNKYSVSPEFHEEFSGDFSREIAELGLTYEFDDLTADITQNPYMSLVMVRTPGGIGFQLNPERIIAIVQWIKRGDVLQASQAAFAAMIEAFNDPWLFGVLHLYFVWLLCQYREEIRYAMDHDLGAVCYMDAYQVYALHYDTRDDINDLQIDSASCEIEKTVVVAGSTQHISLQMDLSTPVQLPTKKPSVEDKGKALATPSTTATLPDSSQGHQPVEEPNNNPDTVDEEDIEWRIPAIQKGFGHYKIPKVKGKRIWNPKILKKIAHEQFTTTSQMVTTDKLEKWTEEVKRDLVVTNETDFQICLTSWCLWCANNGTSSELDASQFMEVHANGQIMGIPIQIFVEPAIQHGGLRKVMRHFSGITSKMLSEGGKMTAWGRKRGFTQRSMIPYAFDFFVPTDTTPKTIREQLSQSKAAAIGRGVQRVMLLDGKVHGSRTSYERHTDNDQDEYEHGGAEDQRPALY